METGAGLDAKHILYLPRWARIFTLVLSVLSLVAGLAISARLVFLPGTPSEIIVISMSVAQISLGGVLFVVSIFFSARDESIRLLQKRAEEFLKEHVPASLRRVSIPELNVDSLKVEVDAATDIFGNRYRLSAGDFTYTIWVGLNVRRIFVIYFVNVTGEPQQHVERLKSIFTFTFGGAELVNFRCHYETAVVGGQSLVSIWLTVPTAPDLLTNPSEKLFWAQDIAMMTESFLRTAVRHNLELHTNVQARPL